MSRPITFQNNKQPCLNAENLNKMQDELNPFRNLFSTHLIQMNTDYRTTADFIKVEPNTTYILSSKDNNVTFQLPLNGPVKCDMYMKRVIGKDFQNLRKAGKWQDVDFLKSMFSAY